MNVQSVYLTGAIIAVVVAAFIYSYVLRMSMEAEGDELGAMDVIFGLMLSTIAGVAWPLIFVVGIIGGIPWWIAGRVVERRKRRYPQRIQARIRELERDLNMTPNSLFENFPKVN